MPNIYSWVINQLDCYPEHNGFTDVVFNIHWTREATDGVHTVSVYGSQGVKLDPDAPFTPHAALTKDQVEEWLVNEMGVDRVKQIDDILAVQIDAIINPPVVTPALPWA